MGRVYLGVHEGRYVAVKQLLASVVGEDADFLRRFGHELDNLARLPAGATAPLLASDREARPPWFATSYVPGLTLREAVELNGGPLPATALWALLREAAAGLAAVHALDMVHRDVKPSNVMLTLDGLTLIDFGVARAAEQSQLTRTGMVVGTPAYMAPEQASGKRAVSGATDVFALGSVLAYAASGRPPFGEESGHGVLYRIVHEEPGLEPLREVDPDLAELVASCLDKDPESRPTAAELLERASRHAPGDGPPWPGTIAERLAERAAFAARVQELDVPTLPLSGDASGPEPEVRTEPEKAPGAEAAPEVTPGAGSRPERPGRRRRTRVFLAVLPVVVVAGGTTLAIQHLPYTASPRAGAERTALPSLSAPAGAAPSASGSGPSGAASPGPSAPSGSPGASPGPDGGAGASPPGTGAPAAAAGGGAGTGTGAGAGAGGNAGGQDGSGVPGTAGTRAGAARRVLPPVAPRRHPRSRRHRLRPRPVRAATATATTAPASPRSSAPQAPGTAPTRRPAGRFAAGATAASSWPTSRPGSACTPTVSTRPSSSATVPRTSGACGGRGRTAACGRTSAAAASTWA